MAALSEAGHSVHLLSQHSEVLHNQVGYQIRAGLNVAFGLGGPSPLNEILELDPDVVHVQNLFPNWSVRWVKSLPYPLVVSVHNYRAVCAAGTLSRAGQPCDLCPRKGTSHAIRNRCYKDSAIATIPLAISTSRPEQDPLLSRANLLLFGSEIARKTLTKYLPSEFAGKEYTVPNFASQIENGPAVEVGIGGRFWVFVGRLSGEKGVLSLLENWPQSETLVVLGDGPLRRRAEFLSKGKNIIFKGNVNQALVRAYLSLAEGLVFPSVWLEVAPLVYVEALSAGTPVIALRGSSVADDVLAAGTGVVFDSFSGLERSMQEFRVLRQKLLRTVTRRFTQEFAQDVWVSRMEGAYERAISNFNESSY